MKMILSRYLEATEYTAVTVQACAPCSQKGYASDHPHGPVAEERAEVSYNPDDEWATLGVHMAEGVPTAHWYVVVTSF